MKENGWSAFAQGAVKSGIGGFAGSLITDLIIPGKQDWAQIGISTVEVALSSGLEAQRQYNIDHGKPFLFDDEQSAAGRRAGEAVRNSFGNALGNSIADGMNTPISGGQQIAESDATSFSVDMARRRANNPVLMSMYDRNQADNGVDISGAYLMPAVDSGSGATMRDLVYRPGEDDPSMTLAGAAATSRRALFSAANNIAFRDRVASMDDPTEIAMLQLDRLRQAGVISASGYASVVNSADQSREAYGSAIWSALNARTASAIASADPVVRNSRINAEYFARFSENPDAYWMGLATIASDLVGQGLSTTRLMNNSINVMPIPQRLALEATGLPGDFRTAHAGLVEGNLRVASDMLPIYDVFNNLGGYKGLSAIADVRVDGLTGKQDPVQSAALAGYRLLDEGRQIARGLMPGDANTKFAESLNVLALHEQRDVLQPVYDSKFLGKTLGSAVDSQLDGVPRSGV